MQVTSQTFKSNASVALRDAALQRALKNLKAGFPGKRAAAIAKLPEFDQLRDAGRDLKNHVLEHLDFYLERFEAKVIEQGGLAADRPVRHAGRRAPGGRLRPPRRRIVSAP